MISTPALPTGKVSGFDIEIEVKRVATSLLEIVDLGEGEIVLQRVDRDAEPLVTISFSAEARLYIMDNSLEVAKAMIQAAIQAAVLISERGEGDAEGSGRTTTLRVLH